MRAVATILMIILAACGGKKEPSSSTGSGSDAAGSSKTAKGPSGTPRPQPKMTVTVDGKPVTLATALAYKNPYGTTTVIASSVPLACSDVTSSMRMIQDGEVDFEVEVAQQLAPDGTIKPAITSTEYDGSTHQETKAATGSGDGSDGKPMTIDVDFSATGAGKQAHALVAKGTLDAMGCPAKQGEAPVALPAEQPASITIAGKKLAVRNAMLSKSGDWPVLTLTTGGESCKHAMGEQTGAYVVRFTWFHPGKDGPDQIDLSGSMLPQSSDQTFDKKGVTIDPNPPTKIEQVKVHADVTVMKYPVQIDGAVTPQLCGK